MSSGRVCWKLVETQREVRSVLWMLELSELYVLTFNIEMFLAAWGGRWTGRLPSLCIQPSPMFSVCKTSNGGGRSLYVRFGSLTGISFRSAWARPASDLTQSDLIDASVQMAMTARARPNSIMISLRKSSPMVRLVSHQTFQPSASSIAASLDANGRSVFA